ETSAPAVATLRGNAALLADAGGEVRIFRQDARIALPALARAGESGDLVYLDPPYESDLYEPLLLACGGPLLAAEGLVVAEHFHKRALPETIGLLRTVREVRVGDHRLSFYERNE
ncbi:MAG TPA: RsmD family RNA methyltransferase, partial [Vicinamibacteria bacterium]|nr:RsmD family RNA methyltransferase [Vicinamibacteria bacterium]